LPARRISSPPKAGGVLVADAGKAAGRGAAVEGLLLTARVLRATDDEGVAACEAWFIA
jgi:hypothetical protein